MRTAADEKRAPKYGYVERERRWLVDPDRLPPLPSAHVLIEDRYITGTRLRPRRMIDTVTGEVALKLAKKYESVDPTARWMVNAYLTEAEHAVFATLDSRPITKRRYKLDGFGIDFFEGALSGLVLAEFEAADAVALLGVAPPKWTIREVTDFPSYQGAALATVGATGCANLVATSPKARS